MSGTAPPYVTPRPAAWQAAGGLSFPTGIGYRSMARLCRSGKHGAIGFHLTMTICKKAERTLPDWRHLVSYLCVLSLVFAVFAHRPVAPANPGPASSSFTLATDSLLPLCLATDHDSSGAAEKTSRGCEFCRLSAAILFPEPLQVAAARYRYPVRYGYLTAVEPPRKSAWQRATPPRGPPYA